VAYFLKGLKGTEEKRRDKVFSIKYPHSGLKMFFVIEEGL